ncbi:MAG TPA: hypothetical protein VK796_11980 [Cytophaga sp.]|nr:hypothetical protein [Cytophaga sp.]
MKRILKFTLITFIIPLVIFSCKKTTPTVEVVTTVTGKVTDKVTGLGLSNVPVMLSGCVIPVCCTPGVLICNFLDTAFTDVNGNYEITFTPDSKLYYQVVSKGNSTYYNDTSNLVNVTVGKTNEINFPLSHIKILQVKLNISNTIQNSFSFNYSTTKSNYFSGSFIIQNNPNILTFDTTLNLDALAFSNYTFFGSSCNYSSGKYTNCNLSLDTILFIQNLDTTKVSFTVK